MERGRKYFSVILKQLLITKQRHTLEEPYDFRHRLQMAQVRKVTRFKYCLKFGAVAFSYDSRTLQLQYHITQDVFIEKVDNAFVFTPLMTVA